jgi:hypothetical protein
MFCALSATILLLSGVVRAQHLDVLVWNNDNFSHYIDPETGIDRGCEYGLEQALQANGTFYTTVTSLPGNLSPYDIVFVELGIYCVG